MWKFLTVLKDSIQLFRKGGNSPSQLQNADLSGKTGILPL
jgi:hypothetical protein